MGTEIGDVIEVDGQSFTVATWRRLACGDYYVSPNHVVYHKCELPDTHEDPVFEVVNDPNKAYIGSLLAWNGICEYVLSVRYDLCGKFVTLFSGSVIHVCKEERHHVSIKDELQPPVNWHKESQPPPNLGSESASKSYRKPIDLRLDLIPTSALRRLAKIYEEGAKVYGPASYLRRDRHIPYSVVYNHLMNHLTLWLDGDDSEDQLAKVAWGVFTLMVLEVERPDMNDMYEHGVRPDYGESE